MISETCFSFLPVQAGRSALAGSCVGSGGACWWSFVWFLLVGWFQLSCRSSGEVSAYNIHQLSDIISRTKHLQIIAINIMWHEPCMVNMEILFLSIFFFSLSLSLTHTHNTHTHTHTYEQYLLLITSLDTNLPTQPDKGTTLYQVSVKTA